MLEGLGEPLHELREAAADLRHRHRQERVGADIRLLDEALALARRHEAVSADEAAAIVRWKLGELLPQIAPEPRRRLLGRDRGTRQRQLPPP